MLIKDVKTIVVIVLIRITFIIFAIYIPIFGYLETHSSVADAPNGFVIGIVIEYILTMKRTINIAEFFPKYLFWDMDHSRLDAQRDKAFIIPRALYATVPTTFEMDIQKLEQLYTSEDIVKYLKLTNEKISNKVCLLVATRYHVTPFERFSVSA